jgi:hypothetical protein
METKSKNNGFAVLEIILLIVTLFFIISIGWVVIHHQNNPQKAKIVKDINLSKYLEVKEWGVYLQLPDTSSKIVYRMEPLADPAQTKKNITISSEALDKFAGEHKECAVSNEFNIITRTKEGDSLNGQSPTDTKIRLDKKVTDGQAKKVGAYYYYETKTSVAPCYGTDIANIQKLTNDVYDLWDKLPTYGNVVVNP